MYNMYIYILHETIKTGIKPPRLSFVICLENVIEACLYLFVLFTALIMASECLTEWHLYNDTFVCQCVMLYVIMHHMVHH